MESFKKYLPWIIVAAVGLFLLRRLSSQSTALIPQTQLIETPQIDPFAESRASAYQGLLQLAGLQIGQEAETERARIAGSIATRAQDIDLAKTKLYAEAARLSADYSFLTRENDRQIQQSAIDRYYSSRNTSNIVSSITQALGNIFGNRSGGNVFGTPPTFPRSGGFSGGFGF